MKEQQKRKVEEIESKNKEFSEENKELKVKIESSMNELNQLNASKAKIQARFDTDMSVLKQELEYTKKNVEDQKKISERATSQLNKQQSEFQELQKEKETLQKTGFHEQAKISKDLDDSKREYNQLFEKHEKFKLEFNSDQENLLDKISNLQIKIDVLQNEKEELGI